MRTIELGDTQVALACDTDGHFKGLLTDASVRRAILDGAKLGDSATPYIERNVPTVAPGYSRNEVVDLMEALRLKHLPIVDANGTLLGLHLLESVLSRQNLPNIAILLAGGKGTRLYPITEQIPKPMLKVAGRPILERLVIHLAGHGIRKIYLATNYLADMIEEHFEDGTRFGCQIEYLREEKALGTAGALSLLPHPPAEPILIANGDLVTQFDVETLLKTHKEQKNAATVGVKLYSHQVPFGCVSVEGARITKLAEKPRMTRLVNAGIYVLNPDLARNIPSNRATQMTDLLSNLLSSDQRVGYFELNDDWIDVGQKESLKLAQQGC